MQSPFFLTKSLNNMTDTNGQRGVASAMKGEMKIAEKYFRKAIEEDQDWQVGGYNLIRLLHMQSRHEEVVQIYEKIVKNIQIQNIHPQVTYMAGESAMRASNQLIARQCFEELVRQHPEQVEMACALSKILIENGELAQAKNAISRALHYKKNDPSAMTQLAIIESELGEYTKAELIHKKLIATHGNTFLANYNYGQFLGITGKTEEAVKFYNKCLEIVPNAPEALEEIEKLSQMSKNTIAKIYSAMEKENYKEANKLLRIKRESIDIVQYFAAVNDMPYSETEEISNREEIKDSSLIETIQIIEEESKMLGKLEQVIRSNESLIWNRAGKPTREGSQTHEILRGDHGNEINKLKEILRREITKYTIGKQVIQEIIETKGMKNEISGWAVILKQHGYQKRHIHPEAIMSGVLYIKIPGETKSANKKEGNLVFPSNDMKNIIPKEGMAVLFPSYMAHETVPTKESSDRICIAFNLI